MPRSDADLFLHEEILLLALRDEKGTVDARARMYQYALAGAIVAELFLGERVAVEPDKKRLVNLVSARPLGDPLLTECLGRIAEAKRRQRLNAWVQRFARIRDLRHRVAAGLCTRGILRVSEDKVLWIFTRRIYPERDPRPEKRIIERLRRAIFTESRTVDPRTVVLLSLAHGAGLLAIPFDRKQLRERKKRIEHVIEGELLGRATREVVQAAQAAATAAAVAATTAATVG
jgi:Golgi phosphoprotein 3